MTEQIKHFGYIYKTTNLFNGNIYIGQKHGNFNKNYFGSGLRISNALDFYGVEKFKVELLFYAESQAELNMIEIERIAFYRDLLTREHLYNIADGGQSTISLSEEAREKIRRARRGVSNGKGVPHLSMRKYPDFIKKSCACGCGRMPSRKYSLYVPGHNPVVKKRGGWNKGLHWSDEIKEKIGKGWRGKKMSLECRKKLSDAMKGRVAWNKGIKGSTCKKDKMVQDKQCKGVRNLKCLV
jgi:hypothetical protein